MKRWKWLLAAGLACGLLGGPIQQTDADEQGWGMEVMSPHVGRIYLYITADGFAIVLPKTGAKFVTHAPDWRVVMYNDKTKVYYVERLDDLQAIKNPKNQKQREQAKQLAQASLQKAHQGRTAMVAGMKATQYFINTYSSEGGNKRAEAWITKDMHPPQQLAMTLGKIFSMDTSGFPEGMPLRVSIADEGGKQDCIFDTKQCQRQTIHTASFTYPPTYKRVENEIAVLMDEQSRKKMESILEDSEDLNSILGPSTSTSSSGSKSSYAARASSNPGYSTTYSSTYRSNSAAAATTHQPAAGGKPQSSTDWWNSMFNSMGPKK